jgi:hypothetical protein
MTRELASIADLVAEGRLVAQRPDPAALRDVLEAARRDVEAADANRQTFAPWADTMLYEAGLRAARVIVQAAGYRIDAGRGAHATTLAAAEVLSGGRDHPVFTRLQRMRRRRNDFMYEIGSEPTGSDLTQARKDVLTLIELEEAARAGGRAP